MNCCCFKILFAAFLLLNSANFQENASKNVQLLDIHDKSVNEMLSDGTEVGIQQGNDVMIIKEGSINLTLTFYELEFEVCDCSEGSQICYESLNGLDDEKRVESCFKFPSSCEFQMRKDEITGALIFGTTTHVITTGCLKAAMNYPTALIKKSELLFPFDSCDPKIYPIDKMIKLQVIHLSSCPIIVKNAKIHVPEVASTIPPPTANSNDSSLTAFFPWWAILIIVFAFVIAGIGIAFVVYYLFKKRQASKLVSPSDVVPKPTVPNKNAATLETPSEQKNDFTKFEPLQKSKKSQKKKTKKQTTTEDAPAPVVTLPLAPILPPPAAIPSNVTQNNYYPPISRVIPRSFKSFKTDSLDETTKRDKTSMSKSMPNSFKTDSEVEPKRSSQKREKRSK